MFPNHQIELGPGQASWVEANRAIACSISRQPRNILVISRPMMWRRVCVITWRRLNKIGAVNQQVVDSKCHSEAKLKNPSTALDKFRISFAWRLRMTH